MWSLEYVQVPIERKLKRCAEVSSQDKAEAAASVKEVITEMPKKLEGEESNRKMSIFQQMPSISSQDEQGNLNKRMICLNCS